MPVLPPWCHTQVTELAPLQIPEPLGDGFLQLMAALNLGPADSPRPNFSLRKLTFEGFEVPCRLTYIAHVPL